MIGASETGLRKRYKGGGVGVLPPRTIHVQMHPVLIRGNNGRLFRISPWRQVATRRSACCHVNI